MSLELHAEPLTSEAFAPFGDVIEISDKPFISINDGNAKRFHDLAQLDLLAEQGRPCISVFSATPYPKPFKAQLMERHPLSSQAFYPLSEQPFLILVAAAEQSPEKENFRLFITDGQQGINLHRGVWHHPLLIIEGTQDFLVIDRKAPDKNCDEVPVTDSVLLCY